MELLSKLGILADAAKYDVSCSSSGSSRQKQNGSIGSTAESGICHSWSDDGRCISLLKILMTNYCTYNCAYCVNRVTNDVPRAFLSPDEVCDLTINFYRRNYIEGLFLSSGIFKSPDYTMELLLRAVRTLRIKYRFNGYIHLKAIPGSDQKLISEAGKFVDRMSVNIELPSSSQLKLLAPQKNKEAIVKPMGLINSQIIENKEEKRLYRYSASFVPAGQSTQLIIGATPDTDMSILRLSEGLYKRFNLKRVYYSAYVPVISHPNLPTIASPPLLREHRLYQADWLLRFYGFSANELLHETHPDFCVDFDPKTDWALKNLHLFPMEINRISYPMLLRIPGIGLHSAQRIANARRIGPVNYDSLKKMGVVLKRARFFITCNGKYYGGLDLNESLIRQSLLLDKPTQKGAVPDAEQISIFSLFEAVTSSITGEL